MAKLYLITHPEVNIDPYEPIEEWTLSEKGLLRVQRLLEEPFWSNIGSLYTSTEPKAKVVADLAAEKYKLRLAAKKCLAEIDRSSTGYIPRAEFVKVVGEFFSQPNVSIRGWETAMAVTKRIVGCVETIVETDGNEHIALIGHGGAFTLFQCYLKGCSPTVDMDQEDVGSIAEADWDQKRIISSWRRY